MKKPAKILITALLTLSVLIGTAGCGKSANATYQTFNTNEYNMVVPTGTVEKSDDPDLPKEIVYWNPTRALKEKYTFEEALKRYAFIAGHSTLIYTSCNELRMRHNFYCVDYGKKRFQNDNHAYFLGADGKVIDGRAFYADLYEADNSSLAGFIEDLGRIYVGNMGRYFPDEPDAPQITVVEQTEDHVFATVKKAPPYIEEGLFYAKVINGKIFYTKYQVISSEDQLTEEDRKNFVRYSALLFDHLSLDDGTEPYIYDKYVNIPILGGKHIAGFDHLRDLGDNSFQLETKDNAPVEYIRITADPDDRDLEKYADDTDWADAKGMQTRENTPSRRREFLFTIGGTRYLCTVYCKGSNDKLNADSPEKLIKLLEKYSYIK